MPGNEGRRKWALSACGRGPILSALYLNMDLPHNLLRGLYLLPTEQCDAQWASSLHKPAREPSSLHVTQG